MTTPKKTPEEMQIDKLLDENIRLKREIKYVRAEIAVYVAKEEVSGTEARIKEENEALQRAKILLAEAEETLKNLDLPF